MPVSVRKEVLAETTSDEVWDMIDRSSIEVDYEIRASEIMRPQIGCLSEDMTLKEASRTLHRYHVDSLPVIDAKGNFVKVISCSDIFSIGLPDLFSTLSKIPDATDTSSFEKFFKVNPKLKIKDLKVAKDSSVINADASLIEIIYEMSVKGRHLLYVLEGKKLIGVIDRCNIIDKIMMG
jgi:CBS domain-containing protein